MRDRIIKFMEKANLSSAKFADDIGVQRSSISHILSGRNNPSFEFIQKILAQYKYLNAEWLIMGTGNMYKTVSQGSLFDNLPIENSTQYKPITEPELKIESIPLPETEILEPEKDLINKPLIVKSDKAIERIVVFYNDKTFSEYIPER